MNMVAQRVNK